LNTDDVQKDFSAKSFLFVAAAANTQLFCGLLGKYFVVSELHNARIIRQVLFATIFSG